MINFIIILIIIIINIAVVDSFGEGNDLMVDDEITPRNTFLQTRFSNGNFAIISSLSGYSWDSDRFYYYLYDSNSNKLINEKKLFETTEFDVHTSDLYEVRKVRILSFNEIDSNNFFITISVTEYKSVNNYRDILYSANFNIQGNRIGDFEYITNKCLVGNDIYSMTKRSDDNFACVLRCKTKHNSIDSYDIYGIGFDSDGKMYGSLNEIFEEGNMKNYLYDYKYILENLQNEGFLILTYNKKESSAYGFSYAYENPVIIKVYNKDGSEVKQINIDPIELEYQGPYSSWTTRKRVRKVYPKSYDNGFIIILTDENHYLSGSRVMDSVNTISWLNYDNDGNLISDRQILTDSHNCDYSKIIKNDNNFYLSCDGFSESFPITLNSQDYNINFINSDERELYDKYEENNKDGITFSTWFDTDHQYLARYNTENIYSFEKILSPTPDSSPDLDSIDEESNENGDIPDDNPGNNPGENPSENPDEDQDNTNEDESNNEGLAIGLSVPLVFVSILLAAYCYLNKKGGFECIMIRQGSSDTKLKCSWGKGNNSLSKGLKMEEVNVQYESDDDDVRGEA